MQVTTPTQDRPAGSSFGPSHHLSITLLGMALWGLALLIGSAGLAAAGQGSPARDLLWQTMRGLDFRTGEMTPELGTFINAEARVPGYMVPLEDNLDEVTEFLLVPYPGACIHVPPPPPNQIIHVTMEKGKTIAVRPLWEAVWVRGMMKIGETQNAYGAVSFFQLTATQIDPYRERK